LRSASRRSSPHQPAAVHERLLARPGDDARYDGPDFAVLSDQFADLVAAGLAAGTGQTGSDIADLQRQALDRFGTAYGICNPLYGVQMVFSEDMANAFCHALNDWLAKEWLDKDDRLRGSIVIPVQSIEKAVAEIERCTEDKRFVQVLMLVMGDMPLGKRHYWPIYAAAERLGLPIGIHAGSAYHNPPSSVGWGPTTSRTMSRRRRLSRPSSPA